MNPLQGSFSAPDRDSHIARLILTNQPDRNLVVASARVNVGGKIVGIDRRDHRVVRAAGAYFLTGMVRQVTGLSVISGVQELTQFYCIHYVDRRLCGH